MIGVLDAGNADTARADVTVVGSGIAGISLALALADAGRRVLLLESGGDVGTHGSIDHLNEVVEVGVPFGGQAGRTRALGGTGALWHGQCVRLHREQIEPQPGRGPEAGAGWPLPSAELGAAYGAAESWLGLTGAGYGAQRWGEHPRLSAPDWDPALLRHDFTEYTPIPDVGRHFRARLAAHPGVEVLTGATVTSLRSTAGTVDGVQVADSRGVQTNLAASTVVIAGGAIENARLLMLSDPDGIGLGSGRWHTGRWLQDHPVIRMGEVTCASAADARRLQDLYTGLHRRGRKLFPKIRLSPQVQHDEGMLDANVVLNHQVTVSPVDAVRRLVGAVRNVDREALARADVLLAGRNAGPLARALWRRGVHGLSGGVPADRVWLDVWLEQEPDPDSRITLDATADVLGSPRARIEWRVGPRERATSRWLTATLASELSRLGLAAVQTTAAMTDDEAWLASVGSAYHPSGTTRMSADPGSGVVDPDLQVHGVAGLYVVGSSVFPTSGYANPTLTIVALALRLADRLAA